MPIDPDPLRQVLDSVAALWATVSPVSGAPDVVDRLQSYLRATTDRRSVLRLLLLLDAEVTRSLMPDVVEVGLGHRDALLVREVLGQLSRPDLDALLPGIVRERLITADGDETRRLAELLTHLGMTATLAELVQSARRSGDPDVREVGEDFGGT